jgi:ribosomal protein S18 acetylase RimI-like enzyme
MFSQQIEILPVTDVDQHAFLGALNAAYADYFIPIRMAPASLAELIRRESIDLSVSAAATYQGQVIGMGMLAHREQRGWIGGMGVIPTFRRQGVGRQIMHYLMDRARDLNLATVQLEVITQNTPAHNLYLSLGFTTLRELHVMTRDGSISRALN